MEYRKDRGLPDDTMVWQSYAVPLIGSIFISSLSFFLGSFGYSFVWILLITAMNLGKSYLWKQRELRLMSLRTTSLREREVIMAQLQDLPAWVQFPDTERVEWMNKVIHQLWPYIGEYAKVFMTDIILPQVRAQMPGVFKNFKFTKMDMGDIPCRVGGIKVYTHNVGRDRIIVDMDIAYAGDADFTVACCGFQGGMNQIQFSGKLRAVLKPLLPYPPMVGGVSASLLEMPKIDFNLTGMGEFVELPGLMTAIRSVVNSQVAAMAVLPNEIVIPLAPNVDVTKLYFPEPDGVVRLKIIEAKNLENRDISFIKKGKSDPYCEIQVGSQFMKTRTIDNDLNPVWNEYFEAVVDQADGQKLRIECFDEDQGQDEELGRLSVDLADIQARGSIDKWFPLEGCKHGDIHLKATWLNLSKDIENLEKQEWEAEWLKADKPIHPALLMVYIDSVADLPYPKSKLEPSPFIEVTLGKDSQRTPVKVKTVNPLFQSKFMFFVRHPEGQELKFEAFDDGTRRSLGLFTLPISQLCKEPQLEYYQQTFPLSLGVHQSPMVITVRLRSLQPGELDPEKLRELEERAEEIHHILDQEISLTPGDRKPLTIHDIDDGLLKEYATGHHIERAEKPAKTNGTILSPSSELNDSVAVEPAKTVNPDAGLLQIETKLNTSNYHLNSGSVSSLSSLRSPMQNSPSRLGRLFKSKHAMDRGLPNDAHRGEVEMSIKYQESDQKLLVQVLQGRNFLPVDKKIKSADPYVSVRLITVENSKCVEKRKTGTARGTLSPVYDNHFEFEVKSSDVLNYKVQLAVKDATNYGLLATTPALGVIEIRLDQLVMKELPRQWIELEAQRK